MAKFDAKSFNPQAFKYKADRIPRTRLNEIRKSKVLAGNPDIRDVFGTQNGTGYARIAVRGLLDGDAVWLHLPAAVICPIVGHNNSISPHDILLLIVSLKQRRFPWNLPAL